jgi:hypothetical protein
MISRTSRAPILVSSLFALLLPACTQPAVPCTSAHGTFSVQYKLTRGDPESSCGGKQTEVLGLQSYFAGGGPDNKQRYDKGSIALRPEKLGLLLERAQGYADELMMPLAPEPEPNGSGAFTTGKPLDDDFCEIPKLTAIKASLPLVPAVPDDPETPDDDESLDVQRATEIEYDFSNLRFLVTADAQGNQFTADLKFTQDGCTAEYEVIGVYPVVTCTNDKECLCLPPAEDATAEEKKECLPTGINPDFAVRCLIEDDPETGKPFESGVCVLKEAPPSYQ